MTLHRLQNNNAPEIAVIGAGAFGGWTALHLLRLGARVTLFDAWGPGHSRSSSGGETRVIRATYGPDRLYVRMTVRALQLWREYEQRWARRIYFPTGVLWMAGPDDSYERASRALMTEAGWEVESLDISEARRRFPQIHLEGVHSIHFEKDGGYIRARRACEAVFQSFLQEGGVYRQIEVRPEQPRACKMESIRLGDGTRMSADLFVFAAGPWMGRLFPDVLGPLVQPSRQEVFFFGLPAGENGFGAPSMPVWIDRSEALFYGIPDHDRRGFKAGDDSRGAPFDPTQSDRLATAAGLEKVRRFLAFRFPLLREAPLVESRVCQYENTPDSHFILDRHPEAENVVFVCGGSGHGFKHGPALGEMAAEMTVGRRPFEPIFQLDRFGGRLT